MADTPTHAAEIRADAAESLLLIRYLARAYRIRAWLWLVLGLGLAAAFLVFCPRPGHPDLWSCFYAACCALVGGLEFWQQRDSARALEAELS